MQVKNVINIFTKGFLKMKKISATLLALCISLSVASCYDGSDTPKKELNTDSTSAVTTSPKSEEQVYGLNETAVFKQFKVTATEIEESEGKNYMDAPEGKVFVGVNFEIENTSEETQNISSVLLFDAYADDVKCDYSFSANVAFGDGTLDGELSPGKKLVGWYAVEIPKEWQKLELEVKSSWLSNNKAKFVFDKPNE